MTTDGVFALIPNSLRVYLEQVRDLAVLLSGPDHPFSVAPVVSAGVATVGRGAPPPDPGAPRPSPRPQK